MYLLKIQRKEDCTEKISLGNKYEYHEYDGIIELIKFIFDNAVYIENYSIREMKNIDNTEKSSSGQASILLSSGDSYGNLR